MKKRPCHICGEKFDPPYLEWYNVTSHQPYNHSYYKQYLNSSDKWTRSRTFEFLRSKSSIFFCPKCHSSHDMGNIAGAIEFVTWAWQYDVTTKMPAVYFDLHRNAQGAARLRLEITDKFTPEMLLSQFTALYGHELTFEQIGLILPEDSVKYFQRKIRGRLRRIQKQWRDREKIRAKKDDQRKGKVREIARHYAEVPPDVIPAIVRISGKNPSELRKIAEFFECLAGRQYWQDQALHREAAELSKVINVMEA
jgi:hypothetical protein